MADNTPITTGPNPGAPKPPGSAPAPRRARGRVWRVLGGLVLAALVGGGALLWMERDPLRAWLFVGYLSTATDDAGRQRWAGYVADLGDPAVPGLCACLHQDDPTVCQNARVGLSALADRWGRGERTATLLQTLAREFSHFSVSGQRQTLELVAQWFRADGPPAEAPLVQAGARLLTETVTVTDPEVHAAALDLVEVLAPRGPEALAAARDLVGVSLRASTPTLRVRAVQLSLMRDKETQARLLDLQVQVANLLTDADVEVRRMALLAVGDRENTQVLTESLLPCLRDPDPEVQAQCRKALGSRGLSGAHIKLAYTLTDPDPRKRLEVLELIQDPAITDLVDPADWLRRLSHDPAPSVRAAAARAMADYAGTDQVLADSRTGLLDRLAQMAQSDPMDSVRQIADYYLRCARE